ncbi:hypothetical protein CVT24_000086 [Panaeolus cyanescens]|uniref:Actin-related protein 8 n=1 Tax=Panaeolus cyanescens TaxID=181874 RepID=A0A409VRW2_9AGAR|nr:hypothetical protein CVT24_000086 [Panaeolus cyanescens]
MTTPSTPGGSSSRVPNFVPTTPAAARLNASQIQSSPHYATTRRHSLYGNEDRVVIDPGSRIWKVGFSGEGRPRDVFYPASKSKSPNGLQGRTESLWSLGRAIGAAERAEQDKVLEARLQDALRSVFHESLLADPKARKVIIVEHPLLPLYIKEIIARVLFDNQVPSISFASSHLLSLLSVGRITGLVIDCGHLESTALPIFAARPLFPQIKTTPIAGQRLTSHLRALLLLFATYLPPPTTLSATVSVPNAHRATRVPEEVLTDQVVEEIKTRCCFVGHLFIDDSRRDDFMHQQDEEGSEYDLPPSSDASMSESELSHPAGSSQPEGSEFSAVSSSHVSASSHNPSNDPHLQALPTIYRRHSTARDVHIKVMPPVSQQTGTGRGTLVVPGWIRERAAEVLFEGGDVDESSIAEVILDVLLKVPRDLRKTMASSILVTGGTAMLPGLIPRLYAEIIRTVQQPPLSHPVTRTTNPSDPPPPLTPTATSTFPDRSTTPPTPPAHKKQRVALPPYDKYAPLRPLLPYFAILNNPSPPSVPKSERAAANAGKAPAFNPSVMGWVGGSLAGALKTGASEISREKWDEEVLAQQQREDEEEEEGQEAMNVDPASSPGRLTVDMLRMRQQKVRDNTVLVSELARSAILPDWTRGVLPVGAPPANVKMNMNMGGGGGGGGQMQNVALNVLSPQR